MDSTADTFMELSLDTIGPAIVTVLACAFAAAAVWSWFNEADWGVPKDRLIVAFGIVYPVFVIVGGFISSQGFLPFVVWVVCLVAVVVLSLLYLLILSIRNAFKRERHDD